tara:strand:+ start:21040 stop:22527 length:1488 start_codon:yes stop_codon:yes gene_type:complete
MSILHFRNFRKAAVAAVEAGWSQSDMAEFYRAHKLLNDHGILIGLDQGITDENEPWLVFYDHETHDVFLHIARIDGTCILICEHLSIKITEKTIDPLIRQFEYTVRNLLDSRSKQNSNVITHPAARIITTVAAVFLLFKIENSRAYASTPDEKSKSGQLDVEHAIDNEWRSASIHRTQINRIFETIDTPLHAAMMAGLIISSAIASKQILPKSEGSSFSFSATSDTHTNAYISINDVAEFSEHQPHSDRYVGAESEIINIAEDGLAINLELSDNYDIPHITKMVTESPKLDIFENHNIDLVPVLKTYAEAQPPAEVSPLDSEKTQDTSNGDEIALVVKNIKTDAVSNIFKYLSSYGFDEVDGLTITVKSNSAKLSYIPSAPVDDNDVPLENEPAELSKVGDISIKNLDDVSENVEKYFETKLHYADLGEMMRIIFSQFKGFEIEVAGGILLVEQAGIDDSLYSEVGLWTNLMADGSEISFIGSLDIIDDITAYMA